MRKWKFPQWVSSGPEPELRELSLSTGLFILCLKKKSVTLNIPVASKVWLDSFLDFFFLKDNFDLVTYHALQFLNTFFFDFF